MNCAVLEVVSTALGLTISDKPILDSSEKIPDNKTPTSVHFKIKADVM